MFRALAALAVLSLGACSSLPPLDFSGAAVAPSAKTADAKLTAVSVALAPGVNAKKSIQMASDLAFPLWKESLSGALAQAKVFDEASAKGVKVVVQVLAIDAPEFGAAMTTKSSARYDVVDAASGAVLFSKVIDSKGVTPADFAFMGAVRAQDSVNRSVRNNISDFIKELQASDLPAKLAAGR